MGNSIGLIGIGLVGSAIAKNLLSSGFEVIGFDIVSKQMESFIKLGGIPVSAPFEVNSKSEIIILSLLNSEVVKEVIWGNDKYKGILESQKKPKIIIDTTTGDPILTEQFAQSLKEKGISYLDATISGSSVQIENKEGVFLVGGDEKQYIQLKEIFDALAKTHIYVGGSGMGSRYKLAVNLVVGLNRLVLAEGLIFAEKIGLDPNKTIEIFSKTQANSKIIDAKGKKMINRDFSTQARISQHKKDVQLILKMAKERGISLPLSEFNYNVLNCLVSKGFGDLDVCAVIKELEERSIL